MEKRRRILLPESVGYAQELFDELARSSVKKVHAVMLAMSDTDRRRVARVVEQLVENNDDGVVQLLHFADELADEGAFEEACTVRAFADGVHGAACG